MRGVALSRSVYIYIYIFSDTHLLSGFHFRHGLRVLPANGNHPWFRVCCFLTPNCAALGQEPQRKPRGDRPHGGGWARGRRLAWRNKEVGLSSLAVSFRLFLSLSLSKAFSFFERGFSSVPSRLTKGTSWCSLTCCWTCRVTGYCWHCPANMFLLAILDGMQTL